MTEPPDDEPPKQQIRFRLGQPVPEHVLHPSKADRKLAAGNAKTIRTCPSCGGVGSETDRRPCPACGYDWSKTMTPPTWAFCIALPMAVVVAVLIVNALHH